ncbi:MAG: hypothetical protein JXA15_12810 [Spirochaetales bacterium]|nr:hypothetical protein [Spirochaetales bacterium]
MGLIRRKDDLTSGARRFLEAAAAGSDAKGRPLPGQARPPALSVADAKSILKDLDWEAPEAADFIGAARIPKEALAAFKTGERPDLLAGALKDARLWPYFEHFICCCCGPCRLCRFYPFCKRRCGRVQVKLSDGSTLYAYRLEIEGVAVEAIPGRPGVAKVSIPGAAGGVTLSDFQNHTGNATAHGSYAGATHNHDGTYALASHATEANPHPGKFAPKSADPNGYADKADLAGKAPLDWASGMANPPTGYADASHGNGSHAAVFVTGFVSKLAVNPPTTVKSGTPPAPSTYWCALEFKPPTGFFIADPMPGTSLDDWISAHFAPSAGGAGTRLTVTDAFLVDGATETPPTDSWRIEFRMHYLSGTTEIAYNRMNTSEWDPKTVVVSLTVPIRP